jgi:DNA replicative helicase MCM subunit Mcm2 (Cdc46/Mcm family)
LIDSFAPDVHGYEAIKGALILQLCNKRNQGRSKHRRFKSRSENKGNKGMA